MNKGLVWVIIALIIVALALYVSGIQKKPVELTVNDGSAQVEVVEVKPTSGLAALFFWKSKEITWQTGGYPKDVGVNINLIRKISNSPLQYVLVRELAKNTKNDGKERWTQRDGEAGNDLFVEVTCSMDYQFEKGCQASNVLIPAN